MSESNRPSSTAVDGTPEGKNADTGDVVDDPEATAIRPGSAISEPITGNGSASTAAGPSSGHPRMGSQMTGQRR